MTAVLGKGPGYTFEVSRVLNELGIKVVWALAWHYDKKYENGDTPPSMKYLLDNNIDFETSVADQQTSRLHSLGYKERNSCGLRGRRIYDFWLQTHVGVCQNSARHRAQPQF